MHSLMRTMQRYVKLICRPATLGVVIICVLLFAVLVKWPATPHTAPDSSHRPNDGFAVIHTYPYTVKIRTGSERDKPVCFLIRIRENNPLNNDPSNLLVECTDSTYTLQKGESFEAGGVTFREGDTLRVLLNHSPRGGSRYEYTAPTYDDRIETTYDEMQYAAHVNRKCRFLLCVLLTHPVDRDPMGTVCIVTNRIVELDLPSMLVGPKQRSKSNSP